MSDSDTIRAEDEEGMVAFSREELMTLCRRVLSRHGFSSGHVEALAETLVAAEMDASHSHGIYRLLGIVATLRQGGVIPDAVPVVEDVSPGVVKVDAKGGFSPHAFDLGLPLLVAKARNSGIAMLAINRCVHGTALWVELEKLTDHGLAAIACNPTQSYVAPYGGKRPLLGTNPIAFGWPREGSPPFIFDFATSAIARGDIELYRRKGSPIPEGWGIDRQGEPTQDPGEVLDHGAMVPFGEHKGSALAIMIELMAGPLIGDMLSVESSEHDGGKGGLPYHGEIIIAIDPTTTAGMNHADHMARSERLFEMIQEQGARLPSQRRYRERERSAREGAKVSEVLLRDVQALLD